MRPLRSPDGCPWDREQTLRTLAPFVLEEAAEVVDAIERDDPEACAKRSATSCSRGSSSRSVRRRTGSFTIADAVRDGQREAHPPASACVRAATPPGTLTRPSRPRNRWWSSGKTSRPGRPRAVPPATGRAACSTAFPGSLPALAGAREIGRNGRDSRFDWPTPSDVLDKVEEEIASSRGAVAHEASAERPFGGAAVDTGHHPGGTRPGGPGNRRPAVRARPTRAQARPGP